MFRKETFEVYADSPALNASTLKTYMSVLKGLEFSKEYREKEREVSKPLLLGKAFHQLIQEPLEFKKEAAAWNMKLTKSNQMSLLYMKEAFLRRKEVREILGNPAWDKEISCYGTLDGWNTKARFDLANQWKGIVGELKTCASASWYKQSFYEYHYDISVGWYALNFNLVSKVPLKSLVFIIQETQQPYNTAYMEVTGVHLQRCINSALSVFKEYKEWAKDKIIRREDRCLVVKLRDSEENTSSK